MRKPTIVLRVAIVFAIATVFTVFESYNPKTVATIQNEIILQGSNLVVEGSNFFSNDGGEQAT